MENFLASHETMVKQFIDLNAEIKSMNETSSKAFTFQQSLKSSYE